MPALSQPKEVTDLGHSFNALVHNDTGDEEFHKLRGIVRTNEKIEFGHYDEVGVSWTYGISFLGLTRWGIVNGAPRREQMSPYAFAAVWDKQGYSDPMAEFRWLVHEELQLAQLRQQRSWSRFALQNLTLPLLALAAIAAYILAKDHGYYWHLLGSFQP